MALAQKQTIDRFMVRRGKRGVLYARRRVPSDVAAKIGKRERMVSLGTSDEKIAVEKARRVLADWDRHDHIVRNSDAKLDEWAAEIGYNMVVDYEEARHEACKNKDARLRRDRANANLDAAEQEVKNGLAPIARGLAELANVEMEWGLDDSQIDRLAQEIAAHRVKGAEAGLAIAATGTRPAPSPDYPSKPANAAHGETLEGLFEEWAAEQLATDQKRPDTVNAGRKTIRLFAEFVGADRDVTTVKPQDVYDFREARRVVPPKWQSNKDFAGLSLRRAAQKAQVGGYPETSRVTVNRELSEIKPLFAWIAKKPKFVGLSNPVSGLHYEKVKGKKPRPSFNSHTLNAILHSPLFTGFRGDGNEHVAGNRQADDWRKWVPLVCMFTGARINEIAQLHTGDIDRQHGIDLVHIREDEGRGQMVKSRKSRFAVLHSNLIEAGFLEFVERRRKNVGEGPLFDLAANERDNVGAKASRWWRSYLTKIGLKNGADGFGAHSFRHTLADRLRIEADLLDNEVAVALGHSLHSVTSGYGTVSQGSVRRLKGYIDALTWEGVDFTPILARG